MPPKSPFPRGPKRDSRGGARCGRLAEACAGGRPPPPWHGGSESPALAPRTWPHPGPLGRERPGKGKRRGGGWWGGPWGGVGGLGQEGSAVRQELGKEGKELRGGSASLALSLASGAARHRRRRGPEKPPVRDAPRPGQLEEQLCVRCGGVRIFAVDFAGFACFLRFPRRGKRFPPAYRGVSPTQRGSRGRGAFPRRGMDPRSHGKSFPDPPHPPPPVLRERSQEACLGRTPALHAQACASQAGSGPGALPAAGGDRDTGPPYSVTAETSAPLPPSLPPGVGSGHRVPGTSSIWGELGGRGVYCTDVHRKPVVKFP